MGFFFGDGSCGYYNCQSGKKASWGLNNASLILLNEYLELCKEVYPQFNWIIMDTISSSGVYKLVPRSNKAYRQISNFVHMYRQLMYSNKSKIIPIAILQSAEPVKLAFWKGLYDADGDKDKHNYTRVDQKSQLSSSQIFILGQNLGYNVSINSRSDKQDIYRLTLTTKKQKKNPIAIKKMYEIPYSGYVYDLTTENHHFAAGVGNMIVHNTDSVFFKFNLTDTETGEKIVGEKALEISIEIAQQSCHQVSKVLKQPHDFEYEKTFMPFCLLSKKRYVGIKFEFDPTKGKRTQMGMVLKRRDNAPIVKDVYGSAIDILMEEKNIPKAIECTHSWLRNLVSGNIPIDKLKISKALRSYYKKPMSIAHKVLADRIGRREPGNKPTSGDRIEYIYIVNNEKSTKKKKILQGDRIETPAYIKDHNMKIDYSFYITNQIMKPLLQLFGLVLKEIWLSQKPPRRAKVLKLQDAINQIKTDIDDEKACETKVNKIKNAEVKDLIFSSYLRDTHNAKNNNQSLTKFFKAKEC